MATYKSYLQKLPLSFLMACKLTKPYRQTETFALYHTLAHSALYHHIKGSLFFSEDEQRLHDAELFAKQRTINGLDHLHQVSALVGFTVDKCRQILDRCEAICVYRDLNGLEPIPPRYYPNLFEEENGE